MNHSDELLFDVVTPLGFRVHCTVEYWQRKVITDYPVLVGHVDAILKALQSPDEVRLSRHDRDVYLFYSADKRRLVCAVARQLGSDGFLITAYPTDKMKEGETVWIS